MEFSPGTGEEQREGEGRLDETGVTSELNLWTSWGGAMTIRAGDDWLWGYEDDENRQDDGEEERKDVRRKQKRNQERRELEADQVERSSVQF